VAENQFEEKTLKLRCAERIKELEVERVVDLCLAAGLLKSLLDIGTGSGLFAEAFATRGVAVRGIDPDPDMIAAACTYLQNVDFLVATAEKLPFPDSAFDACCMGMVLHETDQPAQALQEACRVAKTLVAVLEWPDPRPEDPEPPARRVSQTEIEIMAHAAGFRGVSVQPLQHMVLYLLFKLNVPTQVPLPF